MSSTKYVNVTKALENLSKSDLQKENIEAIRSFIDNCAAEGLSEVRQRRLITALKSVLENLAPEDFVYTDADEDELKKVIASLNRSDYSDTTKHTMKSAVKKFYKVENGGKEHPDKVEFFKLQGGKTSTVSRDELFTEEELKKLFNAFSSTRDKALTMVLYESGARPGEVLSRNIADFTSNEKGDFIYLEGLKGTPDRTNQLVRAGRTVREWMSQHPLGGELGDIQNTSAPLWVKTEQQACQNCGDIPHGHNDEECVYEPDLSDRLSYDGFLRRFKDACERAEIPENKRRPYNLRHTRLTEVATFMGYEQLNKFAGWKPGSDRAKVYVHLNNDDVNQAIRDEYGLENDGYEDESTDCPFCGTENQRGHSECRTCGRPLSLKKKTEKREKQRVIERLAELEEKGVLEKLNKLEGQI
jgi:integrase